MQLFCGIICRIIVDNVIYWRYNNLSEENKSFKRNEKREIKTTFVLFALVTLRQFRMNLQTAVNGIGRCLEWTGAKAIQPPSSVMGRILLGDADGTFLKI